MGLHAICCRRDSGEEPDNKRCTTRLASATVPGCCKTMCLTLTIPLTTFEGKFNLLNNNTAYVVPVDKAHVRTGSAKHVSA